MGIEQKLWIFYLWPIFERVSFFSSDFKSTYLHLTCDNLKDTQSSLATKRREPVDGAEGH